MADPAPDRQSDGTPRPGSLHTAGLGASAVQTAPDHRNTPGPDSSTPTNQSTANPAATGPMMPGGTAPTGTPGGSTPGSGRPSPTAAAPSTGAPSSSRPTVPGQAGPGRTDRPDTQSPSNPTFTPRPAADRSPAAPSSTPRPAGDRPSAAPGTPSRPDPRAAYGQAPAAPGRTSPTPAGNPPHGNEPAPARPADAPRHDQDQRPAPQHTPDHPTADPSRPDRDNHDPASDTTHDPAKDTDPSPRATDNRPTDRPGGLEEPSARDHERVENAVPRNPDGTPQRHPDPNDSDWPGAINGDDPNAPGRNNNCVDVALATVDTYSGHPTPAASRTPDYDADGRPSDRGERGGRDRIENALGAKFSDMGDGPSAYRRLEDTLRQNGHGSQAVIITRDADGRAHAWNAVNHNGKITYVDAQTGQRSDQPLHSGDNGVFAIPLSPDRTPATPVPSTDPSHDASHDRRAPEEAAGTDPDPADQNDTDEKDTQQTDEEKQRQEEEQRKAHEAEVARRVVELEQQGHAPGRHVKPDEVALQTRLGTTLTNPDGSPKTYTSASSNAGHVKSTDFIDPMTGTTQDHDHGGPHKCGPYATKYKEAEDLVAVDDYCRDYIKANGHPPTSVQIEDVLGPEGHERFAGYYKDPTDPSKYLPVDFEGGAITVVYLDDGNGGFRLLTSYANPAPGKHP